MKCPICSCETIKGIVKASGSNPWAVNIEYYPEEDKKKIFKSKLRILKNGAESYYCENCRKIFACFEEK